MVSLMTCIWGFPVQQLIAFGFIIHQTIIIIHIIASLKVAIPVARYNQVDILLLIVLDINSNFLFTCIFFLGMFTEIGSLSISREIRGLGNLGRVDKGTVRKNRINKYK